MDNSRMQAIMQAKRRRMRREYRQMTPEERMARFAKLQAGAMALLRQSPRGYEHFTRRNHHKRRTVFTDGEWRPVEYL